MATSVKTNFVYTIINTVSGLLFPLISFPYISRTVLPEGVGIVSFYNSIIGYVVLLTNLGIPIYGIRAVARVRDNLYELNKTTKEILLLNLMLNIVGYLLIIILCLSVSQIRENLPLFLLLSLSIILTTIGTSWYFSGVEDFRYITIRSLVIKTISLILLFCIVKTKEDLFYYGAYTVFGLLGSNLWNFLRLRKRLKSETIPFSKLQPFRHIKPALNIFLFNLITSIYLKLDLTMIGFLKNNESVGYYTAASNIVHIVLSILASLGQATLPRFSNMVAQKNSTDFQRLAQKSYMFILMVSLPMFVGIILIAQPLVHVFCGNAFDDAIPTIKILSFIIVAIGLSNLFGMQLLYPMGKVKLINISVAVGATANFILNWLLIPSYGHNGAAVATVVAETCVTLTQVFMAYKLFPFKLLSIDYLKYMLSSAVMAFVCFLLLNCTLSDLQICIFIPIIGATIVVIMNIIQRDSITKEIVTAFVRFIIEKSRK